MDKTILLFIFLSLSSSLCWADDSVEAAATGNIVFETAPELVMQDEILTINKSASKSLYDENFSVDVDFHFKNISDHAVTRKIAFVMPPVICREDKGNSMWAGLDADNTDPSPNKGLKDFTTTVDNKKQAVTIRIEAMLDKDNITQKLTSLKIPLNPCKIHMTNEGKPDARYSPALQDNHLLTTNNEAAWSENIYYEWTQTFPAGKVVNIHHHYTPVIGESVLSPRTVKGMNVEYNSGNNASIPIWNRNPESLSLTNPSIIVLNHDQGSDGHDKQFCVMPKWIQYHLTTGANWKGGIGHFKLIIKDDTGAPFSVNQFYRSDADVSTAIVKNMMTFEIKDFVPEKDLFMLFLSLPQTTEELKSCGL